MQHDIGTHSSALFLLHTSPTHSHHRSQYLLGILSSLIQELLNDLLENERVYLVGIIAQTDRVLKQKFLDFFEQLELLRVGVRLHKGQELLGGWFALEDVNHIGYIFVGETDIKTRADLEEYIARVDRVVRIFQIHFFLEYFHHHEEHIAAEGQRSWIFFLATGGELEIVV